jgi:hypothetical protein
VDLGAFRDTNERTWDAERFAFLRECVHDDARLVVAVRVPFAFARNESNRKDAVSEPARGNGVVVGDNSLDRAVRQ